MKSRALLILVFALMGVSASGQSGSYAIYFDGVDDYGELPGNMKDIGITNAFTITMWIKVDSLRHYRMLIEDGEDWNVNGIHLGTLAYQQRFFLRINTTDSEYHHEEIYVTSFTGRWTSLIYSYDGSAIYLFLNGNRVFEQPITGNVREGNRNLRIGFREGSPYLGLIDELRIWDNALTIEQIREGMHQYLSGSEQGLIGYWRFDDGEGNTAGDSTANNNDGTLYGPTWVPSTAPLGPGQSDTKIVNAMGSTQFEDTSVDMDFTSKSETDTFVVTKIRGNPPGIQPEGITEITPNYWVIRQYGNGSSTAELTFKFDEGAIRPEYLVTSDQIKLFYRVFYSDSAWTLVASASSTTDSTVTFSGITQFGQFVIGMIENTSIPAEMVRSDMPRGIRLLQNHPNPFNPSTTITYSIPRSEFVTLKVYDITGREIETLIEKYQSPGSYTVLFANENLPDGIYLYQLQAGDRIETRKMIITK